MSSSTIESRLPTSISQQLKRLRAALGRFLLVDGLSKVLGTAVLVALADAGLDRLFKMDLAQRGIMLVVMILIVAAVAFFRILRPFSRGISDDALILQVEDRNRNLQQSLISAAQFSRGGNFEEQGYSQSMVDATIREGSRLAEQVRFGSILDTRAFGRNLLLLLASGLSLAAIGYGVANSDFWRTWFNRNLLLTNDQWPRNTILEIQGAEDGAMILLRGEDHKQLVLVSEQSRVPDVDVTIEFDDGNSRTRQKMRKTGEREHQLVFRNPSGPFRFRALGGDDITDWVQVNLVDAPAWSEITMQVTLPAYSGVSPFDLPPGGGPYSLLEGSALALQGRANKPLQAARLRFADQQWDMTSHESGQWNLNLTPDQLLGGKYTFDLVDERGLRSSRPAAFTVKIKPDQPPSVRATLLGISGLVVPRARLPVSYTATDEFSVTGMQLETAWTGTSSASDPQASGQDLAELDPQLAGLLGQSEFKSVVVVDLEPMQIPVDVSLRLALSAADNNSLGGPGIGRSREFLLRVVSEEELRADLLRREIEQRKAFELVLSNQEKLVFDLQAIVDSVSPATESLTPQAAQDQLRDAQRRQKLVGTNVSGIADRFQEFLVEAVNNRLDEAESEIDQAQSMQQRFSEQIIQPIRQLDSDQIIRAAQLIELAGRHVRYDSASGQKSIDATALIAAIGDAIGKQNQIIERMQEILSAMMDSETYQEIVNKVIEIKRTEERIREKARQRREAIGGGNIFDDEDDGDPGLFDDSPPPAGKRGDPQDPPSPRRGSSDKG
jgi:hypothetical protein